ncbi:PaaI family thioesterase [Pseudonocardia bannensis]|uniref:PaaI family thioesterase n=1 Tax=Pseudonocardia bannensis TaxID=630973 RepID=UPI0028A739D1|nr:PaaI family thioesterase [Pseudonocardia bannensis]
MRAGDAVVTDVTFDERHIGAPGLTHGGAVAAACDDLFGFVLYVVGEPAVTRSLQVDYLAPVPLHQTHRITARLDSRDGRKLHMIAEGAAPDGPIRFTARATFVVVQLAHFERYGAMALHPGLSAIGNPTSPTRRPETTHG